MLTIVGGKVFYQSPEWKLPKSKSSVKEIK